jgi:unsaturated chondroitin disaccharide hydrolase
MDEDYKRTLERAIRYLCNGADAVCADMILNRGVPRFNYMTGGYTWDDDYVWDSWALSVGRLSDRSSLAPAFNDA